MSNALLPLATPSGVPAELGLRRPTGEVFEMLGFSQGILRNALEADGLRFTACLAPWGWCVSREGRMLAREAIPPNETLLEPSCAPVEIMAAMYTLWSEVYGKRKPQHEALRLGKLWLNFKKEVQALIPQLPTLRVDRVFFRQCLKYVERRHDWRVADHGIHFSHVMGQLRLRVGETEVYCPASGQWLGSMLVSAEAFYKGLPPRFMGDSVVLEARGDSLKVDWNVIPAVWSE